MYEEDRPLILVVCEDPARLARIRALLREGGCLVAAGRTLEAAEALLFQIQVDGCVICQEVTIEEAERLWEALDRFRPGCPKLYLPALQPEPLPGWAAAAESGLAAAVLEAVQAGQPPSPPSGEAP